MYKVGKYKYKSEKTYEHALFRAMFVFGISSIFLIMLKFNMHPFVFWFTFILALTMIVHLLLRLAKARKYIKNYVFNEY